MNILNRQHSSWQDDMSTRPLLYRWIGWFAFANGLFLAIMALRYLQFFSWPDDLMAQVFIPLQLLGHFGFLALLPVPILLLCAIVYPKRLFLFIVAISIYSLLFILIDIDVRVYAMFRFHINSMVWGLINSGAVSEILVFDTINYIISGLVVFFIIAAEYFFAQFLLKQLLRQTSWHGIKIALASFIIMLAGQSLHAWSDVYQHVAVLKQVEIIPWPMPVTIKRKLIKYGLMPVEAELVRSVKVPPAANLAYPLKPLQCTEKDGYNLLFMLVDGLRYDMLNPEVMPNSYALSQQAWRFDNHYSSGNATRFGVFGLFYGLHGSYWHSMLRAQKGSELIRELKDQNYEFGLFANARLSHPEFHRTVFSDIQDQVPEQTPGGNVVERELRIAKDMHNFLKQINKQKFFSLLFYDAPHAYVYPEDYSAPFQPAWDSVNYMTLNNDSDPSGFINRYRNAVHFDDHLIGNAIQQLKDTGLYEKTIIIITGDHGQEFNESKGNYWGHNGNFSRYQTKVPLVIRWPGKPAQAFNHPSSHIDIVPTLMSDHLGCSNPYSDYSNGRHLLDTSPRDFLVSHSWSQFSLIESQRTTVFKQLGLVDVYDAEYQLLENMKANPGYSLKVLQEFSKFLAQ